MILVFIDPSVHRRLPGDEFFFLEPKCDFVIGGGDRIRTVANVATDLDGKIAADGSGKGGLRVRLAQHHSAALDRV